ncbi:MAG: sulfatase, partial [bacterium]|nr:sulfatase [bacterium]
MAANRRTFLRHSMLGLGSGLMILISPKGSRAQNTKRPNVLFAIADDQSFPHAGIYGSRMVQTPAFDRVAREGVLFTDAYASAPQCSPNRATILTGRPIWQLEEAGTHASLFPSKFQVYPDLLEQAGYHIGYTGKPWSPGNWKDGGWSRNPAGPDYNRRSLQRPTSGIAKNDYAGNFEDFLAARPADTPFCFWYGASEPHRGYEPGSGLKAGKRLDDAEVPPFLPDQPEIREDLLDYAREIEWFDYHLGQMLNTLEEIGELENTLIVVTSDNGMPFPGAKATLYDYGTHMPLAVCWGAQVQSGRVVDDFIPFIDFAPTFLDAAGVAIPSEMTGRSFLPVLLAQGSGQIDPSRDYVLCGRERHSHSRFDNWGYPARSIRKGDYLYIHNFKPDRWPAGDPEGYHDIDGGPTKDWMMQHREQIPALFRHAFDKHPQEELFDLKSDLG